MKRTALAAPAVACALCVACVLSAAALPLGLRLAARSAAAEAQSRAETEEERAYRIYAPCSAFEVTVTNGATVAFTFSCLSGHASATVDWGDGTASTHTSSPASHAYVVDGSFVVKISDDISVFNLSTYADSRPFVTAALRWGDSLTSASDAYKSCSGLTGFVPRWGANITSTLNAYYACSGLTGEIPAWNDKITNATYTYWRCSGLTGEIPAWNDKITGASCTYMYCTGLKGAWTDDPALLMPTNITSHRNCVMRTSGSLRALFYSDWGGTRTKEE